MSWSNFVTGKRVLAAATAALVVSCPGCIIGPKSPQLTFSPHTRQIDYLQRFDEAWAAPSPRGGYDLVLTRGLGLKSRKEGRVIHPANTSALNQVLHVHVTWRPARGSKSDYPAATNSSIHWRVFNRDGEGEPNEIIYQGVGFVAVDIGGSHTTFTLRDVNVKAEKISGAMRDPLGPSALSGTVRARNDAEKVRRILAELDDLHR